MTTATPPTIPQTELVSPTLKPQELSFPLPKALHTTGHVHLNFLRHCVMVHLATSTPGDSAGSFKPMGSFVYAMPDVSSPLHDHLLHLLCRAIPPIGFLFNYASLYIWVSLSFLPTLWQSLSCFCVFTSFEAADVCHFICRTSTPVCSDLLRRISLH